MKDKTKHQGIRAKQQVHIALWLLLLVLLLIGLRLFVFDIVRVSTDNYSPTYAKGTWAVVYTLNLDECHSGDMVLFQPSVGAPSLLGYISKEEFINKSDRVKYFGIWPGDKSTMPKSRDSLWWCNGSNISGRVVAHWKMPF